MLKKIIVFALLICLLGTLLCACSKKVTAAEAYQILCTELGEDASKITDYHIHEGSLGNTACWSITITMDGEMYTCYVSVAGKYLGKVAGGHTH